QGAAGGGLDAAVAVRSALPAARAQPRLPGHHRVGGSMIVVDAQIHLWNAGNPTNVNHRQVPAYLKDEALREMNEGGVDAAVITPHLPWDPNGNELAEDAARQHPSRFVILGQFALDKPESRALIDTWKQRPGMLGLRFTFGLPHQKTWPADGTMD